MDRASAVISIAINEFQINLVIVVSSIERCFVSPFDYTLTTSSFSMKQQLNSLQLYRGLASILVVFHHANIILDRELHQDGSFKIFHFGWVGVDFFFILSGFIIFYIHHHDLGKPSQFKSFITKRFLRIYPLYWIVLFGKILTSLAGDKSGAIFQSSPIQFIQAILLVPQSRANLDNFIGVSWTLTHEIFFYILFGLVILLKPKISRIIVVAWTVGLLLNFVNLLPIEKNLLAEFIFNVRNLEFILGCLAAYIVSKYDDDRGKFLIFTALSMSIVSILNTRYHEAGGVSAKIAPLAYGIPFALLIIGSVRMEKSTPLKIPAFLIFLGDASYSIYLTHGFFINNITRIYLKLAERYTPTLLSFHSDSILYISISTCIVVLSIGIGCLTYLLVERPLMQVLRRK
jgi:exopolysaccharide production protein ExoZ